MIRIKLAAAVTISILLIVPECMAQRSAPIEQFLQRSSKLAADDEAVSDPEEANALAEDMEVLSTIIHENLGTTYRQAVTPALTGNERKDPHTNSTVANLLTGVTIAEPLFDYLPGHGVSIQLRVPALQPDPPEESDLASSEPSRWEATRKRLRSGQSARVVWATSCKECHGQLPSRENAFSQQYYYDFYQFFNKSGGFDHKGIDGLHQWMLGGRVARPTQATVIQSVIDTLAENGHHLRGLQPDERVTVSLSYWQSTPVATPLILGERQNNESAPPSRKPAKKKAEPEKANESEAQKQPSTNESAKTVATLRDKKNAIDAYVIETLEHAKRMEKRGYQTRGDSAATLRRLYIDLVGIPPTAEQLEEFMNDGSAGAYQRLVQRAYRTPEEPYRQFVRAQIGEQDSRLPSRTRISMSATKKQLADVANGKQSRHEFARQVEVRVFSPTK